MNILHIDMDAFYASVEARERPELAGRPLVVGGRPEGRGVVAAANYAARRFGVHSAMPMATALRLCPDLIVLPVRIDLYAQVSQAIRAIFERYTPLIEPLSLDEAFLDVAASERLFGPAPAIGRAIKNAIRDELELTASVGIGPNKFIAKIASDLDKPDGFRVVAEDQVQAFLDPLPIARLWGVGKVTGERLARWGIERIGQVRAQPQEFMERQFGKGGLHLWELAHGRDPRRVEPEQQAKSISHETTFSRDIGDPRVLRAWLQHLTEQVAWRLRRHGLRGRTVEIKARSADFRTLTRARTLPEPTDSTEVIWRAAAKLFDERIPPEHLPLRLVGIGVSGFGAAEPAQPDLFAAVSPGSAVLDLTADRIRERFGERALQRGTATRRRDE